MKQNCSECKYIIEKEQDIPNNQKLHRFFCSLRKKELTQNERFGEIPKWCPRKREKERTCENDFGYACGIEKAMKNN